MTSLQDKAKRWRPKFSVRTLVIVLTLVCCYVACWGPTRRQGVEDVTHRFCREQGFDFAERVATDHWLALPYDVSATVPLVVGVDGPSMRYGEPYRRQHYFWFLGYVAKLPYEREISTSPQL